MHIHIVTVVSKKDIPNNIFIQKGLEMKFDFQLSTQWTNSTIVAPWRCTISRRRRLNDMDRFTPFFQSNNTYPGNSSTGVRMAENSRLVEVTSLRGAEAAARTRLAMMVDENATR